MGSMSQNRAAMPWTGTTNSHTYFYNVGKIVKHYIVTKYGKYKATAKPFHIRSYKTKEGIQSPIHLDDLPHLHATFCSTTYNTMVRRSENIWNIRKTK